MAAAFEVREYMDGREGKTLIILLGGGSKRRQDADIAAAFARWKHYQQTKN